jgi:NAD(P)-dependent dehydrogenase (short-subunit alcohol dehydrogenase family)
MGAQLSQVFPPKPSFTIDQVGSQDGRVVLITGGYSGIGRELAQMFYSKNARVYIAGRSAERAQQAIDEIKAAETASSGTLEFIQLELDDLSSIKASVEVFKARETKLHLLFNNAGVSQPPLGSVSKQGIELQLATNCLGPFLFTQLLQPLLAAAAADSAAPRGSVRVVWASSQVAELSSPPEGIIMQEIHNPPQDRTRNYTNSKTGNLFLSSEFARRFGSSLGVVSVAHNPGAVDSNLLRHTPLLWYMAWPLLYKPVFGAQTTLFAGVSPEITLEKNGVYVIPWGRVATSLKAGLAEAMELKENGGTGVAKEFWDFCEDKIRDYA